MANKKPKLEFVKPKDIQYDKTFWFYVLVSKVFKSRDAKGNITYAYIVSNMDSGHRADYVVDDAELGPAVKEFFKGSRCYFLTRGDQNEVVAVGRGKRFLRVDGNTVIAKKAIKIDDSKDEPQIVINNKLDPVTELYDSNGKLIGKIRNNTAMIDVCAQIAQKHLTGYYVKYKGEKLVIRKDGRIKNPPEGFYDSLENRMKVILGF